MPETFDGHVRALEERMHAWANSKGRQLPAWRHVIVNEENNGRRSTDWTDSTAFGERFAGILASTTRSWVNLHAESVEDAALRVVVEFLTSDRGTAMVDPAAVSVNFSGPEQGWWDRLPTV